MNAMPVMGLVEWVNFLDFVKHDTVTASTSGDSLLSSNVSEDRIVYPLVLILNEQSGSTNTVDIAYSGERSDTIVSNINLGANETLIIGVQDVGIVIPRVAGGNNLDFTTGSNNVDVTMYFVRDEVV